MVLFTDPDVEQEREEIQEDQVQETIVVGDDTSQEDVVEQIEEQIEQEQKKESKVKDPITVGPDDSQQDVVDQVGDRIDSEPTGGTGRSGGGGGLQDAPQTPSSDDTGQTPPPTDTTTTQQEQGQQQQQGLTEQELRQEFGPLTERQKELVEQQRRIQRLEETGGGLTPTERSVIRRGITETERVEARQQLRDIRSQRQRVQETGQETFTLETGETLTREALLNRLDESEEEIENFLTRTEGPTPEQIEQVRSDTITAEQTPSTIEEILSGDFEEAVEVAPESLEASFVAEGAAGQIAEAGEALSEEFFKGITLGTVEPEVIERGIGDPFGLGVEGTRAAPREAFQEQLPELTEAQRRVVASTEETFNLEPGDIQRVREQVETGADVIREEQRFGDLSGPVADVAETTGTAFTEFGAVSGRAFAQEVPEKTLEIPTFAGITAATAQDPLRTGEEVVAGGKRFSGLVAEQPIEFGVGEFGADVGLDVLTGGGIVLGQQQVQQQNLQEISGLAQQEFQEIFVEGRTRRGTVPRVASDADTATPQPVSEPGPVVDPGPDILTEPEVDTQPQAEEQVEPGVSESIAQGLAVFQAQPQVFDESLVLDESVEQVQAESLVLSEPVAQAQEIAVSQAQAQEQVQEQVFPQLQPQQQVQLQPLEIFGEDERRFQESIFNEDISLEQETGFQPSLTGIVLDIEEDLTQEELEEEVFTGLGIRGLPRQ